MDCSVAVMRNIMSGPDHDNDENDEQDDDDDDDDNKNRASISSAFPSSACQR